MAARKNVSASEVRAWAVGNLSLVPEVGHLSVLGKNGDGTQVRGRLHPEVIAAFRKANKGKTYETASEAEKRTITVDKVPYVNAAGKNASKSITITTEAARDLLGQPRDTKGRMSKNALRDALAASLANQTVPVAV